MEIKFKEVLTKLMKERKVTTYQIAIATGIKRPSIDYYLKGTASPAMNNLVKLAQYFNISLEDLVFGEQLITQEYIDIMVTANLFKFDGEYTHGDEDEYLTKSYKFGVINVEMTLLDSRVHEILLIIKKTGFFNSEILFENPTINSLLHFDRILNKSPKD